MGELKDRKAFYHWYDGVQFKREDGLVLSINMGTGYTDNHWKTWEKTDTAWDVSQTTNEVEIAVLDSEGNWQTNEMWLKYSGEELWDDIIGYMPAKDAFKFIAWFLSEGDKNG